LSAGTESAFGLAGEKRTKEEVSTRRLSATGVQRLCADVL